LVKDTEDMVTTWKEKHPKQENPDVEGEEGAVLELIRNEGLSIEHLDEETRGRIRAVMEYLHWVREVSMTDIAELIGSKTSGYVSWLFKKIEVKARDFEEGRLKGIADARKHKRNPFDGTDEDKAYLLGISHGDFHVSRPFGDTVRVSTSSTHPAMVELFRNLFEKYGHVYQHSRFKKDTHTYEWNLSTILDVSFSFLLEPRTECRGWIFRRPSTVLAYLAGLFDAEGTIGVYPNARTTSVQVVYYNTDLDLIQCVQKWLVHLGYRALDPYLDKKIGFRSPGFHIEMKKNYWRVMVGTFEEAQDFLLKLPLVHRERTAKRNLALSIKKGTLWSEVAPKRDALRKSVDDEVAAFTKQAEEDYLRRHP
jgi:intein/homing endonuclease